MANDPITDALARMGQAFFGQGQQSYLPQLPDLPTLDDSGLPAVDDLFGGSGRSPFGAFTPPPVWDQSEAALQNQFAQRAAEMRGARQALRDPSADAYSAALNARRARVTGQTTSPDQLTVTEDTPVAVAKWYPLAKKYADQYQVPVADIMAIIENESGGEPGARSGVNPNGQGRAVGLMQLIPLYHGTDGADLTNPETNIQRGVRYYAQAYHKRGKQSDKAMAEYFGGGGAFDAQGNIRRGISDINISIGDYIDKKFLPTRAKWTTRIQTGGTQTAGSIAQAVTTTAFQPVPGRELTPNQFQSGLAATDAMSACGPAAAIAFARAKGRNPTMKEALQMAKLSGWNPQAGMAGPASQVQLLSRMGIASQMDQGADWQKITQTVSGGSPVILSTPQHYFVAERYDPQTGKFDFGNSATVLKATGGQRWLAPADLARLGYHPTASIYLRAA